MFQSVHYNERSSECSEFRSPTTYSFLVVITLKILNNDLCFTLCLFQRPLLQVLSKFWQGTTHKVFCTRFLCAISGYAVWSKGAMQPNLLSRVQAAFYQH